MADLRYNGEQVNIGVSSLYNICDKFPSIASNLKSATNKLISARGFNQCVSGISSNTFCDVVNNCQIECGDLVRNIRQKQVDILGYSQDDKDIQSFLNEINNSEYKALDLSPIESHISLAKKATNFLKGTGSTAIEFGLGLGEGIGKFGETAVDLVDIASTGAKSMFASKDEVDKMWEECKARVSTEHVKSFFDDKYASVQFLRDVRNNAHGGDTGREIGKGLGYAAGMIGLNVATGGLGSAAGIGAFGANAGQLATTAAIMGFSKHTEEAWNDGATTYAGLKYGAASGAWEGVQWYLGAKINAIGGTAKAGQVFRGGLGSVGARIGLSGVDAGAEGIVQPGLSAIYKNYGYDNFIDNYKVAFYEAGGAANIFKNAAMGVIGATVGEIVDARKALSNRDKMLGGTTVASESEIAAMSADPNSQAFLGENSAEIAAREKAIAAFKKKYPSLANYYGDEYLLEDIGIGTLRDLNIEENKTAAEAVSKILSERLGVTVSITDETAKKLINTYGASDNIANWIIDNFQTNGADIDDLSNQIAEQIFASTNFSKVKACDLIINGYYDDAFKVIPLGEYTNYLNALDDELAATQIFMSLETYATAKDTRNYCFELTNRLVNDYGYNIKDVGEYIKKIYNDANLARGYESEIIDYYGKKISIRKPVNCRNSSNPVTYDEFIDYLNNLPDELKGYVPEDITFYDTFCIKDIFKATENGKMPDISDFVLGTCDNYNGSICIYAHSTANASKNEMLGSVVHEIGHNLDKAISGELTDLSDSDWWYLAARADERRHGNKYVTDYAKWYATEGSGSVFVKYRYVEDFAEAVKLYYYDHDNFVKMFPNRAGQLEQFLEKYNKFRR